MNKRTLRILLSAAAIGVLLVVALLRFQSGASAGKVKASSGPQLTALQQKLLSGFASYELNQENSPSSNQGHTTLTYFPDHADDQCATKLGNNIKVNQNCLNLSDSDLQGRGQANNETAIAVNPNNSSNLVAGDNDYRRGDGNCYGAYTLDNANHWNDTTVPMGFTRGAPFGPIAREYWEAGGDTSVAWDTKGNAYFNCMVFNRGFPVSQNPDMSSGIYVFRSTQNNGASWNFPGHAVATQVNPGPSEVPLLDKPYMTVDNHQGSPFQDRIYVTWTLFAADGTANIYESHSNDYGQTFSSPVLVSGASTLCPVGFTGPNTCDENQFSDPFTGPDGNLYVVYQNFNNSPPSSDNNENQILISKSTDGGVSFSAPVRVAPFNDLPDCATYQGGQDAGRACVPEKGSAMNSVFRATNYPSGQVNPTNANQVIVTFGSYINKDSNPAPLGNCIPTGINPTTGQNLYTGVKTPGGCNNKILESSSINGGATFTGSTVPDPTTLPLVSSAPAQKFTDQWWQWSAFTKGGKLAVSYFDRQYGNDETTGNMDISLSGSVTDPTIFKVVRVTSSSMPLPTEFPDSLGNSLFFGDYTGLDADGHNLAYPIWMDTRDRDLILCPGTGTSGVPPQACTFIAGTNGIKANDEDIYMAKVAVP